MVIDFCRLSYIGLGLKQPGTYGVNSSLMKPADTLIKIVKEQYD
jgi:hypothetical protein